MFSFAARDIWPDQPDVPGVHQRFTIRFSHPYFPFVGPIRFSIQQQSPFKTFKIAVVFKTCLVFGSQSR